jgi:hypothetical protein
VRLKEKNFWTMRKTANDKISPRIHQISFYT